MMYGRTAAEFFELVENLVHKAREHPNPLVIRGDDGTDVQVLDDEQSELTAYSLQIMVHYAVNEKQELLYSCTCVPRRGKRLGKMTGEMTGEIFSGA